MKDCAVRDPSQTKYVTDMAGRRVAVPRKIARIASIGAVPVINSYLFALGEGKKIVNGLPYFARSKRWRIQTAIAPQLGRQSVVQAQGNEVNVEALVGLCPDVIITMDIFRIKPLETTGIPVIYVEWRDTSDIKTSMRILGRMLDRTSRSEKYLRYFDATMSGIRKSLENIPEASMPKVLFFDPNTLTTTRIIAEWWIREAGGRSVTAGIAGRGTVRYSHEQVMVWNPDIMIVFAPEQVAQVYSDKRFSKINAVQNKKVYAIPVGAHSWGHRTIEQPLTVLWAAKIFHAKKFDNIDLFGEIRNFYRNFFGYSLTGEEITWMIKGGCND